MGFPCFLCCGFDHLGGSFDGTCVSESDEASCNDKRLVCSSNRYDSCFKLPAEYSVLDSDCRIDFCHYCGKAALRRAWSELYESCSWCTLFSSHFLCRKNDDLYRSGNGCSGYRYTACGFKGESHSNTGFNEYVPWQNSGNDRRGFEDLSPYRCTLLNYSEGDFSKDAFNLYRNSCPFYLTFRKGRGKSRVSAFGNSWRRSDFRCLFYADGLCNFSDYTSGTSDFRCSCRSFNRAFPFVWRIGRGSILRDYPLQHCSSDYQ